ncbi:unnamed protein product [Caretta caretta]
MLATSTNPDNGWSGADGDCKGDCSIIQIMEPLRICEGSKGYFSVLIILAKLLWWDRTELLNWSSFPVPQPQAHLLTAPLLILVCSPSKNLVWTFKLDIQSRG